MKFDPIINMLGTILRNPARMLQTRKCSHQILRGTSVLIEVPSPPTGLYGECVSFTPFGSLSDKRHSSY
jgi:hypothetical protein